MAGLKRGTDVLVPANAPTELARDKHASYLREWSLSKDDYEFTVTEHLRMSGLYWCQTAIRVLQVRCRASLHSEQLHSCEPKPKSQSKTPDVANGRLGHTAFSTVDLAFTLMSGTALSSPLGRVRVCVRAVSNESESVCESSPLGRVIILLSNSR